MAICKRCDHDKQDDEFYKNDRTCKECRKAMVRANRERNIEYYRDYDKKRFKEDPSVRARHKEYAASDAGKIARGRATKKYQERYPMRRAAHVLVGNAVRDGKLNKSEVYETCGSNQNIQAHHDDYTKPLDIRWLCVGCHKKWHRENEPVYGVENG